MASSQSCCYLNIHTYINTSICYNHFQIFFLLEVFEALGFSSVSQEKQKEKEQPAVDFKCGFSSAILET